ncbi:MAG TPA: FecR domain-containing protein [Thermoanaerobaculia bacterium]|nr:FecR domain-containing protein [Thermoanaerobaculia bacterium]
MFKGKRKSEKPVGSDIDWFVIPIERIRHWALALVALLAVGYLAYVMSVRQSPEQKARREIASAAALIGRASGSGGAGRPGSQLAQAQDSLQGARDSFGRKSYDEAFRLAVESQSYARRATGSAAADEPGDASFIFIEGDVSLQTAGRSSFEHARQRQTLFNGDFIRTGQTGSAEIMFSDGTLYTIRPGSLFEVRRPASREVGGSQIKMVSGAINIYTAASSSTVATDAATASIDRESRVAVQVEKGEKTEVTAYRGKATVSTAKEKVVLVGREKVSARVRDGVISPKVLIPETPELAMPPDNRFYDMKTADQIELKWNPVPKALRYRIQISRSRLFVPDATEVDLDDRTTTSTHVKVSREGSYFWRVAAINASGHPSDWSPVRRFKMLSEPVPAGLARSSPPRLTVSRPQQMGNLFLVFGKTDPGAIVTVNAQPTDVESDGSFRKTITINREGYTTLVVKAVDAAGNETVKPVKVFVESL